MTNLRNYLKKFYVNVMRLEKISREPNVSDRNFFILLAGSKNICFSISIKRFVGILDDQRDVIKLQEHHVQSLENEIKIHLITIQQLKKTLYYVEKERDRNLTESQAINEKINTLKFEIELKTKSIAILTEKTEESQVKLIHLQQQFDAVTAEKNALQKSFDSLTEHMNVVRDKLRVMYTHVVHQYFFIS